MDTSFYTYIDSLYQQGNLEKAEEYMLSCLAMAEREDNPADQVSVLNELIGLYRVQGRFGSCKERCEFLLSLMQEMNIEGTLPYATTLLNVANAYRVMSLHSEAEQYFLEVESIYEKYLEHNDYRFASLYNNLSLVYQSNKDYTKAAHSLEKALDIVNQIPDAYIEQAVTCTNLANVLLDEGKIQEALSYLDTAIDLFEINFATSDMHYSATLSAMARAKYLLGNYSDAVQFYEKAAKIIAQTSGKTKNYATLYKNIANTYRKMGRTDDAEKAMDICNTVLAALE